MANAEILIFQGTLPRLPEGCAIAVIDVIRAFTLTHVAVARGAREISLWPDVDSALAFRATRPDVLVVGEVKGLPPEGFDGGNSPAELERRDLRGKALALRTTNGVRAVHTALVENPALVLATGFVNARATARRLRAFRLAHPRRPIVLYASHPTGDEDLACAEYLRDLVLAAPGATVPAEPYRERIRRCEAARKFYDPARPEFDASDMDYCLREEHTDYALAVRSGAPAPTLAKDFEGATMDELGLVLPQRDKKPRQRGITSLLDGGVPTTYFRDVLESHGDLVDFVKFGWGTALVTKDIETKIAVCRATGVDYYFGGTLFERCYLEGRIEWFRQFCKRHQCKYVEISNGTIDIESPSKTDLIRQFAEEFLVLSEVGHKNSEKSEEMSPARWIAQIHEDLNAGATKVITESRESGKSGICRPNGELRTGLIVEILESGIDPEQLIWEAPTKELQSFFLRKLGPTVNFGNIAFADVVGLETLRLGLRSDTLVAFGPGREHPAHA